MLEHDFPQRGRSSETSTTSRKDRSSNRGTVHTPVRPTRSELAEDNMTDLFERYHHPSVTKEQQHLLRQQVGRSSPVQIRRSHPRSTSLFQALTLKFSFSQTRALLLHSEIRLPLLLRHFHHSSLPSLTTTHRRHSPSSSPSLTTHLLRSSSSPSLTTHRAHHHHLVRSASLLTIVVCVLTVVVHHRCLCAHQIWINFFYQD
ncbi:uncharacterized protein DS421_13g411080 [Arachis hypogaea]|nr:uncharacterized protein DS421_13g411080 [Arachis hypogaea]